MVGSTVLVGGAAGSWRARPRAAAGLVVVLAVSSLVWGAGGAAPGGGGAAAPLVAAAEGSAYRSAVLADGPLGYWRLGAGSGGSTARDEMGGHDLSAVNIVFDGEDGIVGDDGAASFDGANSLLAANGTSWLQLPALSVEAWVKVQVGDGEVRPIWLQRSPTELGGTFFQVQGGVLAVNVRAGDGITNYTAVGSSSVADGQWHQVAFTAGDGAALVLYLDGRVEQSVSMATTAYAGSWNDAEIGWRPYSVFGDVWFAGKMDEVAVYDRVLPLGALRAHYAASGRVPPPLPLTGGPLTEAEVRGGWNLSEFCVACALRQHGLPVTTSTGNFWHTFEDLAVAGRGVPLRFARTYNSAPGATLTDGPLGFGWTHNWNVSLSPAGSGFPEAVTVTQENGAQVRFVRNPDAVTYAPAAPRVNATLVRSAGIWDFTRQGTDLFKFAASDGRLVAARDVNGYQTTVTVVSATVTTISDPAGRALTLTKDAASGRITDVTDPAGRAVHFGYDPAGNLVSVTNPAGAIPAGDGGGTTTFGYDANHRMTWMTAPRFAADPDPPRLVNTYDALGRVHTQSDRPDWPLGAAAAPRTTTFDYDTPEAGAVTITDPKGHQIVERYLEGVLVSETRGADNPAVAATWAYRYDPDTLGVTSMLDPNGHPTTMVYDSAGNRTRTIDPLGRVTAAQFNPYHQPLWREDAEGVRSTFTYKATKPWLLTRQSRPLTTTGEVQVTVYHRDDAAHLDDVTAITDPAGNTWTMTYDPATGDLLSSSTPAPANDTTTFTYDPVGRPVTVVAPKGNKTGADPNAFTTRYTYNSFGQVRTITDPLGHRTETRYDPDGRPAATIDGDNHLTAFAYDGAGQLRRVDRADGSSVHTDYDADGNLAVQRDGAGAETSYTFDALNRLSATTSPAGAAGPIVTAFSYDPAGNLTARQDPGGNCATAPAVGCVTYRYDPADQQTAIDYSDPATPDVTVAYDQLGRRTTMTSTAGTTSWAYNSLGRLCWSAATAGAGCATPPTGAVTYRYDLAGRRTALTYPDGTTVTDTYDEAGRLTRVQDFAGQNTGFSYDPNSNLIAVGYPNGLKSTSVFDNADRLGSITDKTAMMQATARFTYTYTYTNSNLLRSAATGGTAFAPTTDYYGYDPLNRLCFASTQASTVCPAGTAATRYSYDNADNLTLTAVAGVQTNQRFDPANQLCWTHPTSTNPCTSPPIAAATTYRYDNRGNRTAKIPPVGMSTTYDQQNRLTQTTTGMTVTGTYTYRGDNLRAARNSTPLTWDESGPAAPPPATRRHQIHLRARRPTPRTDNRHHPHLPAPRPTKLNPTPHRHHRRHRRHLHLRPHGNTTTHTGTTTTNLQYTGQQQDPETGLYYLRARYYDPSTAQFLSRDPLVVATREAYGYAANSPLNFTDPTGLCGFLGDGPCTPSGVIDDVKERGGQATDKVGGAAETVARCLGDPITCSENIEKAISPVIVLGATVALGGAIVIGCVGSGGLLCAELVVFAGPAVFAGLYATYRLADALWFAEGHDKAYHPLGGHHDEHEPDC